MPGDPEPHPAEEPAEGLVAEADGVADEGERQHAGHAVHQVLHHDVADVLGPGETGLDEGEPGLHEEHQRRRRGTPRCCRGSPGWRRCRPARPREPPAPRARRPRPRRRPRPCCGDGAVAVDGTQGASSISFDRLFGERRSATFHERSISVAASSRSPDPNLTEPPATGSGQRAGPGGRRSQSVTTPQASSRLPIWQCWSACSRDPVTGDDLVRWGAATLRRLTTRRAHSHGGERSRFQRSGYSRQPLPS